MFRLMGHVIPEKKNLWIGLTMVYGINHSRSKSLLAKLKINPLMKVSELTDEQKKLIIDELKDYVLESDLKREVSGAIKRLKEIKCYRGVRHNLGLPVRGQVTNKNAKTAKKLLGRAKVRPVLKK